MRPGIRNTLTEVDSSILAEPIAGFPRAGVQREEASIKSYKEEALIELVLAAPTRDRRLAFPVGDAPIRHGTARIGSAEKGIKLPPFFTRLRVQREDAACRCGEVEHTVYHQRRGFKGFDSAVGASSQLKLPYSLKSLNVCPVDLPEPGEPHASRIVTIKSPL